ncbi:MAG: hypothetical protein R2867_22525 [Caldilineaceae bacterium]
MKPFPIRGAVVITTLSLFVLILVRNAWVCDDAYITMRVIDNFVSGYGLRWNVAERVQAYTHPLWMLLISVFYFWTREAYFTVVGLSLALSIGAYCLLWRLADSLMAGLLVSLLLFLSKGFVDFTTSGLETPLVYLLLVLWFGVMVREKNATALRVLYGGLGAALAILTRLDLALLVLPAYGYLLFAAIQRRDLPWFQAMRLGIIGFLPLVAWLLFALLYYGFVLPNTAYAKLNTGIPNGDYLLQGLLYYLTAIAYDPVTLLGIAVAVAIGFVTGGIQRFIGIGIVLSLLYIWRIGGDFMATRFLAPALFCAALLLATMRLPRVTLLVIAGCILLVGVTNPYSPIRSSVDYVGFGILPNGIADERVYYPFTGLVRINREEFTPQWKWIEYGRAVRAKAAAEGRQIVEFDTVGMYGYYAGPLVHVVDTEGLADAFVSHLPARDDWRIGHFQRDLPTGYFATLESGTPQFEDKGLNEYYARLALVTQGPLFDGARLRDCAF